MHVSLRQLVNQLDGLGRWDLIIMMENVKTNPVEMIVKTLEI